MGALKEAAKKVRQAARDVQRRIDENVNAELEISRSTLARSFPIDTGRARINFRRFKQGIGGNHKVVNDAQSRDGRRFNYPFAVVRKGSKRNPDGTAKVEDLVLPPLKAKEESRLQQAMVRAAERVVDSIAEIL